MFWSNGRWDTVRGMQQLEREIDSIFSGASGAVHEFPPVKLWNSEKSAILTAELPGVEGRDIDISVQGETVTLRGSRTAEKLKEGEQYHRRERPQGQFVRTLNLPFRIDAERVSAKFNRGVLSLSLPRAEADTPRKVAIQGAA